jgi:hypothetical protein
MIMLENSKVAISRRDPRLDFFRGMAMFIIFIAHTPGDWWVNWIPARFGFSDATEIFVFCSGMASAIAFGRIFETQGLAMGTARIMHRVWQVYWAHIGLFFAIVTLLLSFDRLFMGDTFTSTLNLTNFFSHPQAGVFGLMTLTYVPNYFDILPMYLVILAMVPAVMALRRLHPYAPFVFCIAVWALARAELLDLPAQPWGNRTWFFNPFSWQLIFFTGFAFMRGWLPTPPIRKNLLIASAVILAASMPFSSHRLLLGFAGLQEITHSLLPVTDKTHFGVFRYIHFLALAYVAYSFVTHLGTRFGGPVVDITRKVGQQSLGVFLTSLFLAQLLGMLLLVVGQNYVTVALMNVIGFSGLIAAAYLIAWFKETPWKQQHRAPHRIIPLAGELAHKERLLPMRDAILPPAAE